MEGMGQMEVPGQTTTLSVASQLGQRRPASHQHNVMLGTQFNGSNPLGRKDEIFLVGREEKLNVFF